MLLWEAGAGEMCQRLGMLPALPGDPAPITRLPETPEAVIPSSGLHEHPTTHTAFSPSLSLSFPTLSLQTTMFTLGSEGMAQLVRC